MTQRMSNQGKWIWRTLPKQNDPGAVAHLLTTTGNFNKQEIAVARELVEIRMAQGAKSGYEFVFLEADKELLAYGCYGPIPGTDKRYDIYWIGVTQARRGQGLGSQVMARMEAAISRKKGRMIFIETSSRSEYALTRKFYRKQGYRIAARVADYYGDRDDKLLFVKEIKRV